MATQAQKAAWALEGGCYRCGKPCDGDGVTCLVHRLAKQRYGARRRARDGANVRLACDCGVPGHYEPTCPTQGRKPGA